MIRTGAALTVWFAASLAMLMAGGTALAEKPAKQYFGAAKGPAPLEARAIGSYARGCLAGAQPLPVTGQHWQAMRLSRNRNWGHPVLIAYIERLARDAAAAGDWPGLLVGDLAQPRGGPMLTGHNSHQIGLDADIWLTPMPDRVLTPTEREEISAVSVLRDGGRTMRVDPAIFTENHARLLARAASYPELARIFVNPAIKRALCNMNWTDRSWLRKIRPWGGHHYHFHVRLSCPPGMASCANQNPPPPGDGCGAELDAWFKPREKPRGPRRARPDKMMADLPRECRVVLSAGDGIEPPAPGVQGDAADVSVGGAPVPRRRPVR